ncbi:AAA family ATPase [Rufibacter radiotolerans]|uniref:AAA family ATPase n=1 Tax=Rufibacter radiotolerans TaxID=1379910 RepID=UPI00066471B5|nr:AAA family ATPase [Rufibacter radiotolerans]
MSYYKLQKLVFDHLYARHEQDNNFNFSVRRKAFTKGSAKSYFTGTEKSDYITFTFWFLPCYYPGASIEAATFILDKIDKDSFRLYFQFFTTRTPGDEPNEITLALGKEIFKSLGDTKLKIEMNTSDKKMFHLKVSHKEAVPIEGFAPVLDSFIDQLTAIVQPCIKRIKAQFPHWKDGTISKPEFETMIDKLCTKLSIPHPGLPTEATGYWWLNCNPKIWRVEDFVVGQEQNYTSHNKEGNKRNVYKNFGKVKVGDLLIGYESTPSKRVKAILEVTRELHLDDDEGEVFSFKIKEFVTNQADWNQIKSLQELDDCQVLRNNQGSLFDITKAEFQAVYNLCLAPTQRKVSDYSIHEADNDLFIDRSTIEEIVTSLRRKKNIILQGAPGVGKTFFAKRLAFLLMGKKDESRVELIQFHQSYAYEDFIRGFRPNEEGKFTLANGIFYDFCRKAQANPSEDFFFIIDEINRGNLSKIFGELLMLIEADKRGPEFAMHLTYRKENEPRFFVPDNVHIIGTMNTADRSLAMVDYALRRRFAFWNVVPKYEEKFKSFLQQSKVIDAAMAAKIIERLSRLNKTIENDKDLGSGFMVGHSYFCTIPQPNANAENWYREIIEQEIKPLLQEYWYDNQNKATEALKLLSLN